MIGITIGIIILTITSFLLGLGLNLYLKSCDHKWKLIESGLVLNGKHEHVGWVKVYECEHCKKIKKEQITVNTK